MERGPDLRASDDERDRAARALSEHWTAGRLDDAELDRRVGAAYAARTRGDLAELLSDLPGQPVSASAPARPRRRFFGPGILPFQERVELGAGRERAFDEALSTMVPALGTAGYHLTASECPSMMRFGRRTGMLSFAVRGELQLSVLFLDAPGGGTRIVAFGEAPRGVRKAFAELRD